MRGRIAQDHKWLEFFQGIQRLGTFHLLGFVQDQDGLVGADDIDGAPGLEVIQFLIDTAVILARRIEGLDVDDHHIDPGIGREVFQLVQLAGIIGEEACLLAVGLQKMIRRDGKGFGYPFADGDAGHHDDELCPAVAFVQLKDGLDIAIGLARTGLHLDIQIDGAARTGNKGG